MGVNQPKLTPASNYMLDTIKVAIPLTKGQHKRIYASVMRQNSWQLARFNPAEGEISLRRVLGLAETDQYSFHRGIMFDIQFRWNPGTRLFLEFSIPKFWIGHNIHLLYNWFDALVHLKSLLEKQFDLTRMKLPTAGTWELMRIDPCYAWRFPSQEHAQAYLDNLKALKFPYKHPVIRKTSIFFGTPHSTYSVKVYLKESEFEVHDMKELKKEKADVGYIDYLHGLSAGVLRFEVTCRKQYLERRGLKTVGHLIENKAHVIWDDMCSGLSEMEKGAFILSLVSHLRLKTNENGERLWDDITNHISTFESGTHLTLPAGIHKISGSGGEIRLDHKGGGFRIYQHGQPLSIIGEMLKKFVGEGEMHSDNQVRQILMSIYKPNKAGRLTGFWVYCQRFGLDSAKETFGRESFYQARTDLKAAGIDLIERPENVTFIDDKFWRKYRMDAPSEHAVNLHDDFRDSTNVLNLPKQA
jgi:hypothetical protein